MRDRRRECRERNEVGVTVDTMTSLGGPFKVEKKDGPYEKGVYRGRSRGTPDVAYDTIVRVQGWEVPDFV